jgi:hypothetical protein
MEAKGFGGIFKKVLFEKHDDVDEIPLDINLNPDNHPGLGDQLDDEAMGMPTQDPERFSKQIKHWVSQLEMFEGTMNEIYKKAGDLSVSSEFSLIYDKIKSPLENISENTGKLLSILKNLPTEIKVRQNDKQKAQ